MHSLVPPPTRRDRAEKSCRKTACRHGESQTRTTAKLSRSVRSRQRPLFQGLDTSTTAPTRDGGRQGHERAMVAVWDRVRIGQGVVRTRLVSSVARSSAAGAIRRQWRVWGGGRARARPPGQSLSSSQVGSGFVRGRVERGSINLSVPGDPLPRSRFPASAEECTCDTV